MTAPQAPILTLTMNPALDVSTSVDRVCAERKPRCGSARFDPGGGGVNVSRAIQNLGGRSVAVYPLGGPTGDAYRRFVADAGIDGREVAIASTARESFTVDEEATGEQSGSSCPDRHCPKPRRGPASTRSRRTSLAGASSSRAAACPRACPRTFTPDWPTRSRSGAAVSWSTRRAARSPRPCRAESSSSSRAGMSSPTWSVPTMTWMRRSNSPQPAGSSGTDGRRSSP